MSVDASFRAEDLCFCRHEHHRHDVGHGCLDCGCGGFRDSIHNLRGLFTDGRVVCPCGHVGSRHGHHRGPCEALGCGCGEFA